jgi:hypothetical protein
MQVARPDASEYAPYYEKYVTLVQGEDVLRAMGAQIEATLTALRKVTPQDSLRRYAPGKWSVREVLGHMIDGERIFAYRALRFARNDRTELPGFEQDDYVPAGRFDDRPWEDLIGEFEAVRRANILMFRGFDGDAWSRRGVASENEMSVRALAYVIAGHELHHMGVIRAKYLQAPASS